MYGLIDEQLPMGNIMQIKLNGQMTEVDENTSLTLLLETLGMLDRRVAIEVNQQVIPRSEHISFILSSNDNVEIIQAVGGG